MAPRSAGNAKADSSLRLMEACAANAGTIVRMCAHSDRASQAQIGCADGEAGFGAVDADADGNGPATAADTKTPPRPATTPGKPIYPAVNAQTVLAAGRNWKRSGAANTGR